MAIFTETVTGYPAVEVYGGLTGCTNYLGPSMSDAATTWLALSADNQKRALICATRFVDRQVWQGVATGLAGGTATTLTWPRSGITLSDGSTLGSTNVPAEVNSAAFELAAIIADDPDVQQMLDTSSNTRIVRAGPAEVEYFAPTSMTSVPPTASALPTTVQQLIGKYLSAAALAAVLGGYGQSGGYSSTDWSSDPSFFSPFAEYTRSWGM